MKRKGERGHILIIVLLLMLLGMLMITPLLNYMSSGLLATRVYEGLMSRQYAADAGVEQALWRIQYGLVGDMQFSDSLNGCAVNVEMEIALTEQEFLGTIADEPPGHVFHAAHPHEGDSDLEVQKSVVDGIVTIDVAYVGEKKSKPILAVVFWLTGQHEFVRNVDGLSGEPEIIRCWTGTSFIWSPMSVKLGVGETATFSFELSPPVGTGLTVAMVKQSSDIWLVAEAPIEFYRIVSNAKDADDKEATVESIAVFRGDEVSILTYEFK